MILIDQSQRERGPNRPAERASKREQRDRESKAEVPSPALTTHPQTLRQRDKRTSRADAPNRCSTGLRIPQRQQGAFGWRRSTPKHTGGKEGGSCKRAASTGVLKFGAAWAVQGACSERPSDRSAPSFPLICHFLVSGT